MAKILITGVNGFVGGHLAKELNDRGHEVIGVGLQPVPSDHIEGLLSAYLVCDLTKPGQVSNLPIAEVSGVISLAGLAQVGASFDNPELYKHINVAVLSVLAEEMLKKSSSARLLAISTGAVYRSDQVLPITEDSELIKTGSPYAQSKILMEEKALELSKHGLDCVIARPFNHLGPGQEEGFLVPDLYSRIVQAKKDGGLVMVGNLATKRDYTDVRDVVRAYSDLIEQPNLKHKLYNICSGKSIEGQAILDLLLTACGAVGLEVKVDENLIRPNDPMDIYGSYQRLKTAINWTPKIKLEQTIQDFVASKASN